MRFYFRELSQKLGLSLCRASSGKTLFQSQILIYKWKKGNTIGIMETVPKRVKEEKEISLIDSEWLGETDIHTLIEHTMSDRDKVISTLNFNHYDS